MNWQVQPSSNASVVPGGGIRFIDVSGEVVRIDGSFLRYGRGLVNDFRNSRRSWLVNKPPLMPILRWMRQTDSSIPTAFRPGDHRRKRLACIPRPSSRARKDWLLDPDDLGFPAAGSDHVADALSEYRSRQRRDM
jgi:hypothetical protein